MTATGKLLTLQDALDEAFSHRRAVFRHGFANRRVRRAGADHAHHAQFVAWVARSSRRITWAGLSGPGPAGG